MRHNLFRLQQSNLSLLLRTCLLIISQLTCLQASQAMARRSVKVYIDESNKPEIVRWYSQNDKNTFVNLLECFRAAKLPYHDDGMVEVDFGDEWIIPETDEDMPISDFDVRITTRKGEQFYFRVNLAAFTRILHITYWVDMRVIFYCNLSEDSVLFSISHCSDSEDLTLMWARNLLRTHSAYYCIRSEHTRRVSNQLREYRPEPQTTLNGFIFHSFIHSFVHSFIHSFMWFIHSFILALSDQTDLGDLSVCHVLFSARLVFMSVWFSIHVDFYCQPVVCVL